MNSIDPFLVNHVLHNHHADGSTVMTINGAPIYMDTTPVIQDDRIFLPAAWVAQALNDSIKWDPASRTVTLISI